MEAVDETRAIKGVGWYEGRFGVWKRSESGFQLVYLICKAEDRNFQAVKRAVDELEVREGVPLDRFPLLKDRLRKRGFRGLPKHALLKLLAKWPPLVRHRRSISR